MTRQTPYVELSAMSRIEAHRKNIYRPPYYLHKWWARRTGSVFRGIALDLLLPPDADVMEAYYERHDFHDVIVLDPFMGGGTTVGECLRLGAKVVGCDLNPVAWFLVSQAMRAVDGSALADAFEQLASEVADPVLRMHRTRCEGCDAEATAQYTSWIKQVPCEECGDLADLHPTHVVMADMATKGAGVVDCPECGNPWWVEQVHARVACPRCEHAFVPAEARSRKTNYRCRCGHEGRILDALAGTAGPPGHRMRMLTVWCDACGKRHQSPSADDLVRFAAIERDVAARFGTLRIPQSEIPPGRNTDQMRKYGYRAWWQMFNARQLSSLSLLFDALGRIGDEASRELLTLLASASLELNSMFCGAKGLGTGAVRHVFAHHAFIPVKDPLEANLWGVHRSSGGFSTLYRERLLRARRWAAAPVERRYTGDRAHKVPIAGERLAARPATSFQELVAGDADLLLLNQSSERLQQIPDGAVDLVITDPPYADNVMYSELSDYFYVWLREAVGSDHPSFRAEHVDDRREAVLNLHRDRDGAFYVEVLGGVLGEATRTLKPDGRLAFTFHHRGEQAWTQLEAALRSADLVVERWWPVFAEMESGVPLRQKENNGHLDIVFVCGRRDEVSTPAPGESVHEIALALSRRVPLVAADHRALLKAEALAAATWLPSLRATELPAA